MLKVTTLSKSYGGVIAVDGVSFTVGDGITGLIGPNGAGKTTVFKLINGLEDPESGQVEFDGVNVSSWPAFKRARLGLGTLFQDLRIIEQLSLLENVALGLDKQGGEGLLSAVVGRRGRVGRAEIRQRAKELLDLCHLDEPPDKPASDLSYGQSKLLAIARLMSTSPSLALLDEPAAGIDPGRIGQIKSVLQQVVNSGTAVLLIEHNLELVKEVCESLIFMAEGQIKALGTPEEVLSDSSLQEVYLGIT